MTSLFVALYQGQSANPTSFILCYSFGIDAAACFDGRLIVKHDLDILLDHKAFWEILITGLLNDRSTSLYHVYYQLVHILGVVWCEG